MAKPNVLNASWESKVDHQLLTMLDLLQEQPGKAALLVAVFVSFQGEPGQLEELGLQLRSLAETVAVATVVLGDIPIIASSQNISYIELARAVTTDEQNQNRQPPG